MRELEKGPAKVSKLSKDLKIPEKFIEEWSKVLEEKNLLGIKYAILGSLWLKLKNNGKEIGAKPTGLIKRKKNKRSKKKLRKIK